MFCSVRFLPHLTIITYNQSKVVGMILQKEDKKCSKGEKYFKKWAKMYKIWHMLIKDI